MARTLLLLMALAGLAADWPRFRGPNGDGHADADTLPAEWDAKKGVLWTQPVPGKGNGSPIIVNRTIYLQSSSADGKERLLLAYDLRTGKPLWSKSLPGGKGTTHAKNTLATSTPAADDQRVYLLAWDGHEVTLFAFSHGGEKSWQQSLGSFSSQHGAGGSPMVTGDLVIVNDDQDGVATLRAFDRSTGRPAWQTERQAFRASYGTPFIREGTAGPELVVASTAGIAGYDPANGKANWEWTWDWSYTKEPLRVVGSPIQASGLILACTGNGGGNSHIVAVDPVTRKLAWERKIKKGFPYVPCVLAKGDHLYTVSDQGIAGCYDAKTGKEQWTERLGGGFSASPVLVGGNIVAINEEGTAFTYPATPTKPKAFVRHPLGAGVMASPAVADGRLVVRTESGLVCVGEKR